MRKRMISLAVVALICAAPVAFGGQLSATPIAIDLATAPDLVTLPDVSMTFGNDLVFMDRVSIFVDGADAAESSNPLDISCDGSANPFFGYLSTTQDSWGYRVTSSPDGPRSGTTCTFRELQIRSSSLARDCSVSVRYTVVSSSSGNFLDSGGPIPVATFVGKPPAAPSVFRDSDRTVAAFYDDGVTRVSAIMAVQLIESSGHEYRFASVTKVDLASGEAFECFTDQSVEVKVSQSGRAEGRATVSAGSCPAVDGPIAIACRPSDATLATLATSSLIPRGSSESYPKKLRSRAWSFEPLGCSIVAFGAEYQTDVGTAYFMETAVIP